MASFDNELSRKHLGKMGYLSSHSHKRIVMGFSTTPSGECGRIGCQLILVPCAAFLLTRCATTNVENCPRTGKMRNRDDYLPRNPIGGQTGYHHSEQLRMKALLSQPSPVEARLGHHNLY